MSVDTQKIIEAMALAARQVGLMARRLQGQVVNEGKDGGEDDPTGDDYLRRQREAKTAVDEVAQDIIITALAPHLPVANTLLDGEEETPGKALLPASSGDYVLVLDPIDGTLIYTEGGKAYSVNIALFHKGRTVAALMYYPAYDVAYYTDGASSYRVTDFALQGLALAQPAQLQPQQEPLRNLFFYYRVDPALRAPIEQAGFVLSNTFRPSSDAQDPVSGMLCGSVNFVVLQDLAVRDLVHCVILQPAGVRLLDWQGQPLAWPARGGKLGKALITLGAEPPAPLLAILKSHG